MGLHIADDGGRHRTVEVSRSHGEHRATGILGVSDGRKAGTAAAIPARSSLGGDLEGVTVLLRLVRPRRPRRAQGGRKPACSAQQLLGSLCHVRLLQARDPLRLTTILGGTAVARAIRRANAHGVTVGGTSAGAAILSEHMIAYGAEGNTPHAGAVTLVPGFGLTNRIMIDQHFRQRDRLGRLLTAIAYNPFAVGVGLDEDTAAFIDHTKKLSVVGAGALTIVDASELQHSSIADVSEGKPVTMTNVRLHILAHGASFDLETRKAATKDA